MGKKKNRPHSWPAIIHRHFQNLAVFVLLAAGWMANRGALAKEKAATRKNPNSAFPKLPASLFDIGRKRHPVSGRCHFTKYPMTDIPKIDQLHLAPFAQTQSNLVHPIGSQAANDRTGLASIVGHGRGECRFCQRQAKKSGGL